MDRLERAVPGMRRVDMGRRHDGGGGAMGLAEGVYDTQVHGASAAVLLTLELISFSLVLLTAAARGTLDVFLFASLMLYTASMAFSVPQLSAMSISGERVPPWPMQLHPVIFGVLMLGVGTLRLELLRRGTPVGEMFGRAGAVPPPPHSVREAGRLRPPWAPH